jgi:hypothetical protein
MEKDPQGGQNRRLHIITSNKSFNNNNNNNTIFSLWYLYVSFFIFRRVPRARSCPFLILNFLILNLVPKSSLIRAYFMASFRVCVSLSIGIITNICTIENFCTVGTCIFSTKQLRGIRKESENRWRHQIDYPSRIINKNFVLVHFSSASSLFLGSCVVYCSPPPPFLIFYHPRRTFFFSFFNLASNFHAGRTFLIWLLCKRLEMLAEGVWDSSKNVKSCAGAVICWSVCVCVCVSPPHHLPVLLLLYKSRCAYYIRSLLYSTAHE